MENFEIIADYHTHTIYSHGTGTIRQNVEAAITKGLKEVGISDHGMGHKHHGIKRELLKDIRKEVDELNEEFAGIIKIFLSVEANILSLDGKIDITDEDREFFDFVMLGYHRYVKYESIKDFNHFMLKGMIRKNNEYVIQKSTESFIQAVNKNNIDIITHPGDPLILNLEEFAKECAKTETSFEINCKHKNLDVITIEKLAKTGVTFVIGSDAHRPQDVGEFDSAIRILQEAMIPFDSVLNICRR